MSNAVVVPPFCWRDCDWKVVQRKAPGAMSAIALIVRPVRLRVRFISVDGATLAVGTLAMRHSSVRDDVGRLR